MTAIQYAKRFILYILPILLISCKDNSTKKNIETSKAFANTLGLTNPLVTCRPSGYCTISWETNNGRNIALLYCDIDGCKIANNN